jgi:hypothetical protein
MNTETLINASDKEIQPVKSIDIKAPVSKDAERDKCGNGVCEVAWKPFAQPGTQREVRQPGA